MATRREFIKWTAASGVGLAAGHGLLEGTARAAPLAPAAPSVASTLTPYVDQMPLLVVDYAIDATGGGTVNLTTALISRKVHRDLPATPLFGYLQPNGPTADNTYLGPPIVAKEDTAVKVNYTNLLQPQDYTKVFTNGGSSYEQFNPFTPPEARILTHLHGGFVAGTDDGNPFQDPVAFKYRATQSVTYPNEQPATLLWYHDHLLGDTRMNVVAGLAGGYLLRDSFDTGDNRLLPGPIGEYELVMVVQDRQFNPDGSLLYPVAPASMNGPWIGEYFGDLMLVNGKIWPNLTVEPAVYRFRVLNGCNARILNLGISSPTGNATVPMYIIGSDGGLLPLNPARTNRLLMGPAERYDVICDFRGFAGQSLLMKNTNPPSPVSTPAPPLTKVMQITVNSTASSNAPMAVPSAGSLEDPQVNKAVAALTALGPPLLSGGSVAGRMITLNEVGAGTPSWRLNLNAHPYGDPNPVTETLTWNSTEDWYFVNTTGDTHPMHTHLFTFRVMGRYEFDVNGFVAQYGGPNGVPQLDVSTLTAFLKSGLMAPDPEETGLKDTVKANPGQITVVRAKYSLPSTALNGGGKLVKPQNYVHHCHIVEHEDNDMMERVIVQP